ncbi:MAG: ATP-binding response regulator [Sporichthyaceae bacterium]
MTSNVRADMDDVDWAATPLGPRSAWPQSLRTTVEIMLTSRFSMWMAWGPQLTFFCNDAYRRDTLGEKYPWALGRLASEVWAEIWADIGPRIDSVLATGVATWDEALLLFLHRSGYPEETYHTFSYSPLADDEGTVAGMLCVVMEDTERVIGARRMQTLRDLAAATASTLTVNEVFAESCDELGRNRMDVPFALFYARTDAAGAATGGELKPGAGGTAELACAVGLDDDHPAAPQQIDLAGEAPLWPLTASEVVVDLDVRFGELPRGDLPAAPDKALVLPLRTAPGRATHGWLVLGLNRFRPLDEAYRTFINLAVAEVNAAVDSAAAIEEERRRATALAELDAAKTRFFTNISHELRTPLTLILGPAADMLHDGAAPLPERQRRRAEMALRNGERLLGLVNTLLDFSRIQAGRARCRRQSTDLARYTAELAAMFESVITSAGLSLTVDAPPLTSPVTVDREMWTKIVLNLLSNALKFTFDGGIAVELCQLDGEFEGSPHVELRVRDTGIGIEPAEQAHLFERFHRVAGARSRTFEGTGIGLALVAELAELHGGAVSVESAPGVGSTFAVRIPATGELTDTHDDPGESDEDAPATAARFLEQAQRWVSDARTASNDAGQDPSTSRERVLLVDDNADMRTFLLSLLSDHYDVEAAFDGLDALTKARARAPDLVLTDVMMPNLDGFGLLKALRADEALREVPVIMVSARAGEDGVSAGLEAGATDYVLKPFSARELLARVRATLDLDRSRREGARTSAAIDLLDRGQQVARIGFWSIEVESGATSVSSGLLDMLGMTAHQVTELGFEASIRAAVHPEDQHLVLEAIEAGIRGEPMLYTVRLVQAGKDEVLCKVLAEVEFSAGQARVIHGFAQAVTREGT